MVFLLLSWIAVGGACFSLGSLVIGVLGMQSVDRTGDRLMIVLWTGVALLGLLLLGLSLVTPLTPALGVILTAALLTAAAAFPPSRREFFSLGRLPLGGTLAPLLICAGTAALLTSAIITSRDSISYHYDLIYLLSRTGTVPGLALVHDRYGFLSSWFTIPAVFNHGALTGRVTTLANGFAILLSLLHCWLVLRRLLHGSSRLGDRFLLLALPPAMFMPVLLNYTLSASPDFVIVVLTVVMVWLMILLDRRGPTETVGRGLSLSRDSLAPLILAAAAVTIKLAAAPALPVAFLYHFTKGKLRISAAASGALVALVLLSPSLVSRTVVTGCPLYPAPLCLDLSWSAGEEGAELALEPIARARKGPKSAAYLSPRWFGRWLKKDRMNEVGTALFSLSVLSLLGLALTGGGGLRRGWFVWLLAAAGIAFLFATSPQTRFAWAYLAIVPAYVLALRADPSVAAAARKLPPRAVTPATLILLAGLSGLFLSASYGFQTQSEKLVRQAALESEIILDTSGGIIIPPEIPRVAFHKRRAVETRTIYDLKGSPSEERGLIINPAPDGKFVYRDPLRGPAGGFIRPGR